MMANKFLFTTGGIFLLAAVLSQPSSNINSNAQGIKNVYIFPDTPVVKPSMIDSFELKKKILDEKLEEAENTLLELNKQQKLIKDNQNKISSLIKNTNNDEYIFIDTCKDEIIKTQLIDTNKIRKYNWIEKLFKLIKLK